MRYLRRIFEMLAGVPETPERTALAFSVGVFLSFSPFLGLHTVMGVLAALIFRLNRAATMLGAFLNVPWLLVPYYGFATWVGIWILGTPQGLTPPPVGLSELLSREFWNWLVSQWRLLIPCFVGSTLLSVTFALAAYPFALRVVRLFRLRGVGSRLDLPGR